MARRKRRVKTGDHWRVLYRVGTPDRCRWSAVIQPFSDKDVARREGLRRAREGHKVVIMRDKDLQVIGPPVGWNPEDADAGHFDGGWWIRDAEPQAAV